MSARLESRIVVFDSVDGSQRSVVAALEAAEMPVDCCVDLTQLGQRIASIEYALLWANVDLGSSLLQKLLSVVEEHRRELPVVLMSDNLDESSWVRQMKTGVVEVLQGPFSPRLHLARLRILPTELPQRTGQMRGKGTGAELDVVLSHLSRLHRTGVLVVNEGRPQEGKIFLSKGQLKGVSTQTARGHAAFNALRALQALTWSFIDSSSGLSNLIDLEQMPAEDESFIVSHRHGESARPPSRPSVTPVPGAPAPTPAVPPAPSTSPEVAQIIAASHVRAPSTPAAEQAQGEPVSVLFVDDDQDLARMLGAYFAKKGYAVATAGDGVEAMQRLMAERYDLIIADLNMPRLDGWGLLKLVREDFRTHEIPLALFSCHEDYREQLRALNSGAQAYYPKSLRMNGLELQVRELLEPRLRFRRLVSSGQSVMQDVSKLGPQWVLRALAQTGASVQLDAQDSWASYRLHLSRGRLCAASARSGANTGHGERALMGFMASRAAEGSCVFGTPQVIDEFGGAALEPVLAHAVATLNEEQRRAREDQLHRARQLQVQPELFHLYMTVGPPAWRAAVQLLCESRMLPRDVMGQLQLGSSEMSAILKDLVRRGVVVLS